MEQNGIIHSACYEENRADTNEFVLCMGRAECTQAKQTETLKLIAAPEALSSPEGKRK